MLWISNKDKIKNDIKRILKFCECEKLKNFKYPVVDFDCQFETINHLKKIKTEPERNTNISIKTFTDIEYDNFSLNEKIGSGTFSNVKLITYGDKKYALKIFKISTIMISQTE